ncbi:hypothetical protein C1H46_027737 [Malus baccata]|uniref:non-specific serine/threonine protein kinase n=1 Tax=Malus baccata TaxID=106549 RepID=A0A540LJT2_MALBA|nr:hypothetical protein C1H46_027737 [Malus baccata]
MSKPSLILQLTKLVLYHILLWQLGRWPQSKFHCGADVAGLPVDEVSALQAITRDLELKQQQTITDKSCDGTFYGFTINCDCNNATNLCRISKIEINNLDLTGTIHEAVSYLSNLTYLSLANNKLHGSIPDTWGNLMDLEYLDLSSNQLSGLVPASLGNLVSLQNLCLNNNLLSGGIPRNFGSLTNLIQMTMQFNKLSGSIPDDFGKLLSLSYMDLSENQLSGPLPESLGNLSSLRSFYVSANYLSGEFPKGYDQLTSLEYFSIAGNYISGPLPVETIANWTNINYVLISDLANDGFQLPPNISNSANFISLTLRNCSITGPIPKYIGEEMTSLRYLDLSFNKLTGGLPYYMKSDMIYMNLFACCRNPSTSLPDMYVFFPFVLVRDSIIRTLYNKLVTTFRMDPFEMKNKYCPRNKPKYHSLFINCGGEETTVLGNIYDQDNDTSPSYTSPNKNWAYSLSGDWLVPNSNGSDYIKSTTRGVSITEAPLYEKARLSPVSLKYYAFCLRKGNYTVTLYFNEIVYTDDANYTSLRKRAFDVYIQGNRTVNYFDIIDKAGNGEKPITVNHSVDVVHDSDPLEIHLYWPGKGSTGYRPSFNGPLISAISLNPEIKIGVEKIDDELQDKFVTIKELIKATENFSDKKKLGRYGTVYKAKLQGHIVAVKKLDPAQFKKKIEDLNKEIGTIRSLQHQNILQLLDGFFDKDLQLLVYEYMEKQSLADILFGSNTSSTFKLEWNTRVNICLGIAKGLNYLHEHPRVQILHRNIKSANILLNENFEPKISDFGFASLYTKEDKVKVITREVPNLMLTTLTHSSLMLTTHPAYVQAYQALAEGNLKSLVDKSLSKYDEKEALVIMKLAVYCTTLGPSVRPKMSEVVSVLVREKTLDEVFPPAKLTGDSNVAGSTSSGKTSAASTSSNDHGKVFLD